ncbi:MAG: hypothetical protein V2I37_05280 [Marinilabiliaceae bacterium]|jgi:hypothetical protein|nr:hypothetical protein [Marinilabiliaceae bacterium]
MKLIRAITNGSGRAVRSIKPVLIIWLVTLFAISLLAGPLKSALISATGSSNATSMIADGFSIDFWTGLIPVSTASLSGLLKGVLVLLVFYIFIGVFLNGGLFDSLKANVCGYPLKEFFRASAANFLSFLVVTIMVILMILLTVALVIGLPLLIVRGGDGGEAVMTKVMNIMRIVLLLVLPVLLLVADYARAWLSGSEEKKAFKALGYGFKATFNSFISSYIFMLLMVVIQGVFAYLASMIMNIYPSGGGGLFLFFLLTQALVIIRIFLRALRYGGVTTLHTI